MHQEGVSGRYLLHRHRQQLAEPGRSAIMHSCYRNTQHHFSHGNANTNASGINTNDATLPIITIEATRSGSW
jgi:hypothetical protein